MKKKNKIITIFLSMLVTIALLTSILNGTGILRQKIFTPYGTAITIADDQKSYNDGSSEAPGTFVVAMSNYANFQTYTNSVVGDPTTGKPYCKIGGQYTGNTHNEVSTPNSPPNPYNKDWNLFYCKTTKDLINLIQIPSSWSSNNLILYCNDAANINSRSNNYDPISTLINAYKICIVKNSDLSENNSILYGFETGNRVVDDDGDFLFDKSSKTGGAVIPYGFNYNSSTSSTSSNAEVSAGYINIPYQQVSTVDSDGDPISYYVKNNSITYIQSQTGILITRVVEINDYPISGSGGGASFYFVSTLTSASYTQYEIFTNQLFSSSGSIFTYNDVPYYYEHSDFDSFFTLRDFNEPLDTNIGTIFSIPTNFELSRVALFTKNNNKIYYGYETASLLESSSSTYSTSLNNIYKIKSQFGGFSTDVCKKTLSRYVVTTSGSIVGNTQILCNTNAISIVSKNLNGNNYEKSFELFKNIMLSLQ